MSNPLGYTGVFRYSDQYPDAVAPWWDAGNDLDDVTAELRELIDLELCNPRPPCRRGGSPAKRDRR